MGEQRPLTGEKSIHILFGLLWSVLLVASSGLSVYSAMARFVGRSHTYSAEASASYLENKKTMVAVADPDRSLVLVQ